MYLLTRLEFNGGLNDAGSLVKQCYITGICCTLHTVLIKCHTRVLYCVVSIKLYFYGFENIYIYYSNDLITFNEFR